MLQAARSLTWIDIVDAHLAGLDYPRVASLLNPLPHMCSATPNSPSQQEPRGILWPFQLGSAHALFSSTLRIPALGCEAALWKEERAGGKKRNGSWLSTCCPFLWHCLVSLTTVLFCQICFIFCMISSRWAFQAVISKFDLPLKTLLLLKRRL